jgi:hypothetical protein
VGLDCRELLDVKAYEFLLNWFMREQRRHQLDQLQEPLSYDGFSAYDQLAAQLIDKARIAYIEQFGEPPPPIALTNLFHLAELELAGVRDPLRSKKNKSPQ